MKVLLMVTALNGLSQRVLCYLQRTGHDTAIHIADGAEGMRESAAAERPDLILCPFLKSKVPEDIWRIWKTIIIHPGPAGDQGPSSLDWAITEAEPRWGVTALQAVDEMDAGPIWATRTFAMPDPPVRKSALYNGPVADGAMSCVEEVVAKATDPTFNPTPLALAARPIASARLRPPMTQADRAFGWDEPTDHIIRRINAADGSPGISTELAGLQVYAYDAHPARLDGLADTSPGTMLGRRAGAVHVRTGDGALWLGHLRSVSSDGEPTFKLPATSVLQGRLGNVPRSRPPHHQSYRQVHYRREGNIGWLTFTFYNGAMSTRHCRRMLVALRHAIRQDTRVLVVRGSNETFSNGIHLNVIEAAEHPAGEAWANIKAINAVCKRIISTSSMKVITAFNGSAGAGGVMLGLGADVVVARDGVVLNPYYDMGLFGSELHTYTLPRRVGEHTASKLLEQRKAVDTAQALSVGLVDDVGPRDPDVFNDWLGDLARSHAFSGPKPVSGNRHIPLDAIEVRELAEMSRDMFDDRLGFAAARHAFVHKIPRQPVAV